VVKEGTAKAVTRLGKFQKIIFQWENHWMDNEWNIWYDGEVSKIKEQEGLSAEEAKNWEENLRDKTERKVRGKVFGGWWFYGWWPLWRVHKYLNRWRDLKLTDKEEVTELHEELTDSVLLKPAVYVTDIKAAETRPPERIPLDLRIVVTLRIRNPYKFLFIAPPTPIEDVLVRISAMVREIVATLTIDEILKLSGKTDELWKLIKEKKLVKETLPAWGFSLAERGVEIKDITPPPEYREALAKIRKLELEAEARAAETVGTVLRAMAQSRGKKVEDIQMEIENDPKLKKKFLQIANDLLVRKLAIEGKSYVDIRVMGARGMEKAILDALAAWKRMPGGTIEKGKPTGTGIKREITKEDIERLKKKIEEKLKEKGLS
jgi:hypothetical protein